MAQEYKLIRLMEDMPKKTPGERWLILPSAALRSLVLRRLLAKYPELNYVCRWKDRNGYGLHVTHAEWVPSGHVYEVPN